MPLYKHIRDDVDKFTFVEKTEFKGARFFIYYKNNGKLKHKILPYRANREQLLDCLESIKKEIGYYEKKRKLDILVNKKVKEEFMVGFTHDEK